MTIASIPSLDPQGDQVESTLDRAIEHFSSIREELLRRTSLGRSFERYLNAEFAAACQSNSVIAVNEAGYATFGLRNANGNPSEDCADVLLIDRGSGSQWILEATLVGTGTQLKWKQKIVKDAAKLSRIRHPKIRRFLLLYCTASHEQVIDDGPAGVWDPWFSVLEDSCSQVGKWSRRIALGEDGGQFAIRFWEVGVAASTIKE
jgi:hypothetical protein